MTDLKPDTEYLSDAQLDAIAALDVNLADDTSIQTATGRRDADRVSQLEMDLEWTQRQRETAEKAEAVAESAFQAAKQRADTAEQCVCSLLVDHVLKAAADDEGIDLSGLDDAALDGVAETVYEDWIAGIALDDIDVRALMRGWAAENGR